jgi:hypothetical protein
MRGRALTLLSVVTLGLIAAPLPAQFPGFDPTRTPRLRPSPDGTYPVFRLVDVNINNHVYTLDRREVAVLTQQGTHRFEGVAFQTFADRRPGTQPLFRFVRPNGRHLLDIQRRPSGAPFARLESVLGHIATEPAFRLVPLNVWVQPQHGLFFYTTHPRGELAPRLGYHFQGVIGFVVPGDF